MNRNDPPLRTRGGTQAGVACAKPVLPEATDARTITEVNLATLLAAEGLPPSNLMSRPRRILVNSRVSPRREVNVMTRRVRGWLYAGIFFVVSGVLVAMPSVAHAGISLNAID
jgi:hypothetical protein